MPLLASLRMGRGCGEKVGEALIPMGIGEIPHHPTQRSIWPQLLWCHSVQDNALIIFLGMDWASEVSTDPVRDEGIGE
jgi:hypothetical protein